MNAIHLMTEARRTVARDLIKIRRGIEDGLHAEGEYGAWKKRYVRTLEFFKNYDGDQLSRVFAPLETRRTEKFEPLLHRAIVDSYLTEHECLCPEDYREIIDAEYPDKELLGQIKSGELQIGVSGERRPGIFITGKSGVGKTRGSWELLKRWILQHGEPENIFDRGRLIIPPAYAIKATDLRQLAIDAAMYKADAVEEWREISERDQTLLFIDDLDKAKFTPGFAERFYDLIEDVTNSRRPFIATAQVSGRALVNKWIADDPRNRDTAEAIVRRLVKDHCVMVRASESEAAQ